MRLLDFSADTFSQKGEDGVLAKILETLPATDRWAVEFGAWDGEHLSNTCNLIENRQYSAVLIEASAERFKDLQQRHGKNPRVIPINQFVGFTPESGLDTILARTPIPKDFDLLSIDIDGNDYHVWNATHVYTPKIVCIEFNPTMPTEIDFVQEARPEVSHGSSLLAMTKLGRSKGYELVCVTRFNAIFVRACYFPLFGIANPDPRALREDFSSMAHLFTGFDGTIFVRGMDVLPWHKVRLEARIRQLPKMFRAYPEQYGPVRRWLFKQYRSACRWLGRA